jgi:hypothetical protein
MPSQRAGRLVAEVSQLDLQLAECEVVSGVEPGDQREEFELKISRIGSMTVQVV